MNGDAFFYGPMNARQLSDYIYDLYIADGAPVSEAWAIAEAFERLGRAACVREIEEMVDSLKRQGYNPMALDCF